MAKSLKSTGMLLAVIVLLFYLKSVNAGDLPKTVFHYKLDNKVIRADMDNVNTIEGTDGWAQYPLIEKTSEKRPEVDTGIMLDLIPNPGVVPKENHASLKFHGSAREGFECFNYWEQPYLPEDIFTIEGFLKVDSDSGDYIQPIYAAQQNNAVGWDVHVLKQSDEIFLLGFTIWNTALEFPRRYSSELSTNKWYHFAWTYQKDNNGGVDLHLYIDGFHSGYWHIDKAAFKWDRTKRMLMQMSQSGIYSGTFGGNIDELRLTADVLYPDGFLIAKNAAQKKKAEKSGE